MEALLGIGSGFGLSSSAGLNAYIPLLITSLMTRFGFISMSEPYDVLGSWWVIGVLVVLLVIETFVDKIPVVDTTNDLIQTFIRPAAGALLFAANANLINDLSPVLAVIIGIILAGGVHATKTAARPVVTTASAGTGNWFISIVEDVVAFVVSIMSILLPILGVILMVLFLLWVTRIYRRRRNRPSYR